MSSKSVRLLGFAIVVITSIGLVTSLALSSSRAAVSTSGSDPLPRRPIVRATTTGAPTVAVVAPTIAPVPAQRATTVAAAPTGTSTSTGPACPWLNAALPVATRVDLLLKAMTPLQEATLLHLRQYSPSEGYEGYSPAIPALCIPKINEQDGAAGVATDMDGVTQLPAPIADAAAFDPPLAERYGDVIGSEDAAKGVDLALSPTINIDRSPQWGRSYESLGEDPFLTASLAVPIVRGIQSNRVVAVVKHFAVYNQETNRATMQDDSIVSDQALHEIYLPAFSAVVQQAGAGAVMCSYNLINGTPACQDAALLNGILRQQWHFDGFVRSDCGSVYDQAAAIAVDVSQVKCSPFYNPAQLAAAVADGTMSRATLDDLARPLLTVLFRYDLIAAPHPERRYASVTSQADEQVARQTDDEGTVLLRNQGGLLPLDFTHLQSLALIGPSDGTPMPAGFGAMYVHPTDPSSALGSLRAELGSRLLYSPGTSLTDAADVARQAQVAIVVVHDYEAEKHDRTSLDLPGDQDALVEAVAAANPHTVVVLETGSAVLMPWLDQVPAVLETWYPGETAGTALADVLSGRVDPSGKLPVTFPASATARPDATAATFGGVGGRTLYSDGVDVGYRWYDANDVTPAFPFGFGLTYTSFGFSKGSLAAGRDGWTASVSITNTGKVRGADVVQCYVGYPTVSDEAPRQLRAFQRVDLLPGQSEVVALHLTPGDLGQWSTAENQWIIAGGVYHVWMGDSSDLANLPVQLSTQVQPAQLGVDSGPAPVA